MAEKVYNRVIYRFMIIFSKLSSTFIFFIKKILSRFDVHSS